MDDSTGILPGLPVMGNPVHVAFDGGQLTSDAGILPLAAVEVNWPPRQIAAVTYGAVCPKTNPSAQPQTPIIRVPNATQNHVKRPLSDRKPVRLMNDPG